MRALLPLLLGLASGCDPRCASGDVCVVLGTGELGFNGDGLAPLDTRIASPTAVRIDGQGRLLVVDYSNMRLRVIDEGVVSTVVGNGAHAYSVEGASALATPLENPVDAGFDALGRLTLLPQHEGRVIAIDDGVVVRIAGTGRIDDSGDGGPALDATMGYGGGMAYGPDGSLFISDNTYARVRHVAPDGTIDTVLGTGSRGSTLGPTGPETALSRPERLVVDQANGRLIVADTDNHRVLALDLDTLAVSVVAGTGSPGRSEDGADALGAALSGPVGVEVRDGDVYIADLGNNRLLRVRDGQVHTVAGAEHEEVRRSAPARDMAIDSPAGLAWQGDDLLIAERGGHRVLRWVDAATVAE